MSYKWHNIATADVLPCALTVHTYVTPATIAPFHRVEGVSNKEENPPTIALLISLSVLALAVLVIVIACFFYLRRRKQQLSIKGESISTSLLLNAQLHMLNVVVNLLLFGAWNIIACQWLSW